MQTVLTSRVSKMQSGIVELNAAVWGMLREMSFLLEVHLHLISHLLCGCSIPGGCRCSPCPRSGDKSAQCVYDAIFCAARSLCQSGGDKHKVPQLLVD